MNALTNTLNSNEVLDTYTIHDFIFCTGPDMRIREVVAVDPLADIRRDIKTLDASLDEVAGQCSEEVIESMIDDAVSDLDIIEERTVERMIEDAIEDMDSHDEDKEACDRYASQAEDYAEKAEEHAESAESAAEKAKEYMQIAEEAKDEVDDMIGSADMLAKKLAAFNAVCRGGLIARLRWIITGK